MKILLLGFNKKNTNYEIKKLIKELEKRGHDVDYVFWKGLIFSFSKKGPSIKKVRGGKDLKYYDFIIPRSPLSSFSQNKKKNKSKLYLSHLYRHYLLLVDYTNKYGKHILNEKTSRKMLFYDKLFQHYLLSKEGLPVIPSVLYTGNNIPDTIIKKFKKPFITKSIEGSRGKQVFLVNKKNELEKKIEEFGVGKMLVQKNIPSGFDFRIIVIGNKVVGGMKRIAPEGEFRSNASLGGYVEPIKISTELGNLAKKAARVFSAEFAGVDIIKDRGKYYILEINIFPMFEGFERATNINVSKELAVYIEKKYLWSIEHEFTKKEKEEIFESLYKIEKDNPEQEEKPRTKTAFLETILKRDLIVIYKNQQPIAFMSHYEKENVRRITRMGILKDFRGQRMGRRMIKELIKLSRNNKNSKINVIVPETNKKRRLSFKKAGFTKTNKKKEGYFKNSINGLVYEYKIQLGKKTKGAGLTKKKRV